MKPWSAVVGPIGLALLMANSVAYAQYPGGSPSGSSGFPSSGSGSPGGGFSFPSEGRGSSQRYEPDYKPPEISTEREVADELDRRRLPGQEPAEPRFVDEEEERAVAPDERLIYRGEIPAAEAAPSFEPAELQGDPLRPEADVPAMITIDPAVKQMLERLKGYYASPGAIPESGEPTPAPPPDDDQIKIVRPGAPDPGNFFDQPTPPTGPPLAGGGGSGDSNNFRFDPLGFREVGLLIRGIGPDGFPFQEAKGCTFSMLGERWALGALHCFTSAERWRTHVDQANWQTAAGDLSWSELDHEADRLRAFLQKPSPVVGELEACFDSTDAADCPYLASRVARVIVPRAEWAFGHRIPIPDIALLELEFEVGGGLDRLAELAAGPFAHDRITFAGYGLSDLADHVPGRSLLVSWHTAPRFEAGEVTWTVLPDGTSGGPCSVDSGGPVFGGDLYGYADEQHTLVAIISSMSGGEGERAERCLDSVGFAVPVAPHRADLCELSEGALRGCG